MAPLFLSIIMSIKRGFYAGITKTAGPGGVKPPEGGDQVVNNQKARIQKAQEAAKNKPAAQPQPAAPSAQAPQAPTAPKAKGLGKPKPGSASSMLQPADPNQKLDFKVRTPSGIAGARG